MQALKPNITHITSWRNVISIERTASAVFVHFCLVLLFNFEKGRILYGLVKTYNCIVFPNFQHIKLYSFQNLSLGFSRKIFLKFRKISASIFLQKVLIIFILIILIYILTFLFLFILFTLLYILYKKECMTAQ